MITDLEGKEVQLVSNKRYTNVVKVRYEDGTEKDVSLLDLTSSLGRKDLVAKIQDLSKADRPRTRK